MYMLFSIFLFATLSLENIITLELQSDENENEIISSETDKEFLTTRSKPNPLDIEVFKDLEGGPMIQNLKSNKDRKMRIDFSEADMIKFKIWPDGIAPYYIDSYSFDEKLSNLLRNFIDTFNSLSSFRLVELSQPPDNEDDRWLLFINRRNVLECQDYNTNSFTTKGVQRVVVGYDCLSYDGNLLVPTLLAIAGVPPQHNAPNRNEYITVVTENIIPEKRHMFTILKDDEWSFHHFHHYDFHSGGHYDFYKYTINGSATIQPLIKINIPVGEQDGISVDDVAKLMTLYTYSNVSNQRTKSKVSDCYRIFKSSRNSSNYEEEQDTYYVPLNVPYKHVMLTTVDNISSEINTDDPKGTTQQKIISKKEKQITKANIPIAHKKGVTQRLKTLSSKRPKQLKKLKKRIGKKLGAKKELKEIIKHKIDYRTSSDE